MSHSLAEAQSPNLPPATFLSHFRAIRDLKRLHDEAGMALARAKKSAKADGVDLGALKIVEQMRKLDDDEAEIRIRHAFEYSGWLGKPLGTQSVLFPEIAAAPESKALADQQEWEAGDAGYLAGKGGKLRSDNPFPEGSPVYVRWDREFVRGLKILAAELRTKEDLKADKTADRAADKKAAITKLSDVKPGDIVPPAARRGRQKRSEGDGATTH